MKHAESSYSVLSVDYSTGLPSPCSCPLHAFARLKKALSIYIPLFFQMLELLVQTRKSKASWSSVRYIINLVFYSWGTWITEQWNELPEVPQDLQRMEWRPLDFHSFIEPLAYLLLTQPQLLWMKICDTCCRDKHRTQPKDNPLFKLCPLPKFRLRLSLERLLL